MTRIHTPLSAFLLLLLCGGLAPAARADASTTAAAPLPRPATLAPAIAFWTDVFSRYDFDQVAYLDGREPSRVYEVRRIPTPDGSAARARARAAARERFKDAIRSDLEFLAGDDVDYGALSGRRLRLFRVWDSATDPAVYARAARNLRGQRGIRNSFLEGVERSARYLDDFRRIFRDEGVPEDLVHLPHVESGFRHDARSGAGAVGMWQFLRGTGRRFLLIDPGVDERLDPHASARAAARYLRELHEETGAWPLAITAYNQGPATLQRAVRELGTEDIGVIVREYEGPGFGFMGRNFYAELLAARDLAEDILSRPADWAVEPDTSRSFDTYPLPAFVKLSSVERAFGLDRGDLHDLNRGFTDPTLQNREYLPKGYALRLPPEAAARAHGLFSAIPETERHDRRPVPRYRVKSGETLGSIARRHRTSVRAIQRLNGIDNPNRIRAGQVLKLPY